ncbi:MAG: hypothetical protein HOP09_02740 [Hyphomicrobium sp.]|nr:hypothetical protein [Hyphomicrobium sp.]
MRTLDLDQFWPLPSSGLKSVAAALTTPVARAETAAITDDADAQLAADLAADSAPEGPFDALEIADDEVAPRADRDTDTEAVPFALAGAGAAVRQRARSAQAFFRSFDVHAAGWLSMGFVAGMVSWHAVGFWGFVSQSVLNGPGRSPAQIAAQPTTVTEKTLLQPAQVSSSLANASQTGTSQITTGSLPTFVPLPGACMALTVDRTTGATVARTCDVGEQPMRDAGRRRKGDRMPGAEARLQEPTVWASATTATPVENALTAQDLQAAPPAEQDFDLRLRVEPQ